jgi:hypothetical protein
MFLCVEERAQGSHSIWGTETMLQPSDLERLAILFHPTFVWLVGVRRKSGSVQSRAMVLSLRVLETEDTDLSHSHLIRSTVCNMYI